MSVTATSPGLHPALAELSGTVLESRYELGRVLGAGGMGAVFEATHLRLDRQVAIKVLRPVFVGHDEFIKRFLREAKVASRIHHRNVVEILDFGEAAGGLVYSVMALLQGMDLDQLLRARSDRRLPWPRACGLLAQIAAGLKAAHACGVIHRDVKPANCFLTREDGEAVVKVVDFGIAKIDEADQSQKLTGTTDMLGTPSYIAPELVRTTSPASPRSDIYSLGVLAYRMLTGQLPFTGETAFEVLHRSCFEPARPLREHVPEIPSAVDAFVLSLLAKQPQERPQDMLVVRDRLLALVRDVPGSFGPALSGASSGLVEVSAARTTSSSSEILTLPRGGLGGLPSPPPPTIGWASQDTALAPALPAFAAVESTWVAVERVVGDTHEPTLATPTDSATGLGSSALIPRRPRRRGWLVAGGIATSLALGLAVGPWLGSRDEAGGIATEPEASPAPLYGPTGPDLPASQEAAPTPASELEPTSAPAAAEPLEASSPPREHPAISSPTHEPTPTAPARRKRTPTTAGPPSDKALIGRLVRGIRSSCADRSREGPVRISFLVLPSGTLSGLASIPATSDLGKCAVQQIKGTQFRSRSEESPVSFEVE